MFSSTFSDCIFFCVCSNRTYDGRWTCEMGTGWWWEEVECGGGSLCIFHEASIRAGKKEGHQGLGAHCAPHKVILTANPRRLFLCLRIPRSTPAPQKTASLRRSPDVNRKPHLHPAPFPIIFRFYLGAAATASGKPSLTLKKGSCVG